VWKSIPEEVDMAPNDVIFNKTVVSEKTDEGATFGIVGQFFV
jgi:hypothetical protein